MKKLFYLFPILLTILCFQACDMLEVHPYDAYVRGEKNLNEKNIQAITTKLKDQKEFRFAFISDTQRWYDETESMVSHINKRGDVDFVIHGGDLSDFGATMNLYSNAISCSISACLGWLFWAITIVWVPEKMCLVKYGVIPIIISKQEMCSLSA